MYIYKTTNNITGHIYIGQSSFNINESESYLGSGKLLKQAISKYGKENFKKEILQQCNNIDELNKAEIYWIEYYDSRNREIGYNILKGGIPPTRNAFIIEALNTPEYKEKSSKINLKKWEDDTYRAKVTESNKATWSNPELRKKHSENQTKRLKDPVYRKKLSDAGQNMAVVTCPHCDAKGKLNHMTSKHFDNCVNHPDEKIREAAIARKISIIQNTKKITCPHCNLTGAVGNMNRWHFDNCKKKVS
jgi:group I intron endonuclease